MEVFGSKYLRLRQAFAKKKLNWDRDSYGNVVVAIFISTFQQIFSSLSEKRQVRPENSAPQTMRQPRQVRNIERHLPHG